MKLQRTIFDQPALYVLAIGLIYVLMVSNRPASLDTVVVMATYCVLASSLALIYGQAGVMSLAQAAMAAVGGYTTAVLTVKYGFSPAMGLVAAIVLPALVGYVVARLVGRLSHLALAVATILIAEIIAYVIAGMPSLTGGYIGLPGVPAPSFMPDIRSAAIVGVVLAAASTLLLQRVARSQQGRALRTIAADRILANSVGISMPARLSATFALSAGMAGVAGWFYAHSRLYMTPDALSVNVSLTVLFMVIVGGAGTVIGPVAGAVGLTYLQDRVPQSTLGPLYYGLALIVVLLIMPRGLFGTDWRRALVAATGRLRQPSPKAAGERAMPKPALDEEVAR